MTYLILVKPTLFLKVQAGKTNFRFPKTFLGEYLLNLLNILIPKMRTKKYLKLCFNFKYCKLPKLTGCLSCFTLFKPKEPQN